MTRIEENSITTSVMANDSERQESESSVASSSREKWLVFLFGAMVLILDIITKEIVRNNLPIYTYWAPFPALENFFRFTHTANTGVAFGLFQNGNLIFAIFASVVSIGIIYFNQQLETGNALLRVALGLQLGGALGNLLDRLRFGSVTDFLDFGPWPVFNVADTAVVAGVILMGIVLLQEERKERSVDTVDATATTEEASSPEESPNQNDGTAS